MTEKICPILTSSEKIELAQKCIEGKCGFWNEEYKACGLRLAMRREGIK